MTDKPKGHFTPGANLSPQQIERVMLFLSSRGKDNAETLSNLTKFFELPKLQPED